MGRWTFGLVLAATLLTFACSTTPTAVGGAADVERAAQDVQSESDETQEDESESSPEMTESPTMTELTPSSLRAGTATTLAVTGTGFTKDMKVVIGGVQLVTTFVSRTSLSAQVPADWSKSGALPVVLLLPMRSGVVRSNELTLNVMGGVASTSVALAPSSTLARDPRSGSFAIEVSGNGFDRTSTIMFGGVDVQTTYIGTTSLRALVPSSLLETPGQIPVSVLRAGTVIGSAFFTITDLGESQCGGGTSCAELDLRSGECFEDFTGRIYQCEADGCMYKGCL